MPWSDCDRLRDRYAHEHPIDRNVRSAEGATVRWALNRCTAGRSVRVVVNRSSICLSNRPYAAARPCVAAAPRANADILGLADLGTVAPGKSTSAAVLDVNPLEDIGKTRPIAAVYLRGEPVDRSALQARFMDGVR